MQNPRSTGTHGGALIADVLAARGVAHLFTLCGGHISPILVGAKARGIRVVDVRDEVSAVFAADAVARMTGIPGVAAVTAGPGVTNTVTAVKNAQMAQSPVVVFGGATGTLLKGRGSLQDIDQLSIMKPITKWATTVRTLPSLAPTVEKALDVAASGVPGPVFVEVPVDLLYPEDMVREMYLSESGVRNADHLGAKALELFIKGHLYRQFHQPHLPIDVSLRDVKLPQVRSPRDKIGDAAAALRRAQRPALVVGSQALVNCRDAQAIAAAVESIGAPVWLGGLARGLLGRHSDIQFRHKRSQALREADVVVVAGFPFDFRLKYGRAIGSKATLIAANLSAHEMRKNRRADIAVQMNAGQFLIDLAAELGGAAGPWDEWLSTLRDRERARDAEIAEGAKRPGDGGLVNPLDFFLQLEDKLADDAVLVVDGGDFVATAAYILRPRGPLRWLDPGVFGTLGVGGGFAIGASLVYPQSEVWLIYGDGSCAYSLAEFDTYARHGLAPIAVIGTDGSWAQIAREQVPMLGDDVGTVLARTAYHEVARGYGGEGLLLTDPARIGDTLDEAKAIARSGRPVCVNVHIARSDFREGSISM
ncbi:MAG: thiamine pyrophosphate-binding protein [Deltaproteobacteria bacterium]|nr:MAG: thiamine pyrophosphate-binding protein [Deltaproteobacteria bacterium]